ncbi:MAG: LysR family transcriptional regulator [Alphaproteobacteria bacterium]|nr:LysR family transcriptional regulator [Alphaproteobacteria bacterium]
MSLDQRQMQIFLAVVREGSLGRASRALNLTQPAVSKAIRRLEDDLEVKLFERSPQGMMPTEYGEALRLHAELISTEMTRAREEIQALRGVSKGRILVGVTPSVAAGVLPRAVGRLLQARPGLTIRVTEGIEGELLQALMRGETDLAIIGAMRRIYEYPVAIEALYRDRVSVVCRTGHPLRRRKRIRPADLLDFPWVLPGRDNVMWRRLSEFFYDHDLEPPEPVVLTGSASFMRAVVAGTDSLSYLPRVLIQEDEAAGRLTSLSDHLAVWTRQVIVVWRKEGSLPLAAVALIEELKRLAREPDFLPASAMA